MCGRYFIDKESEEIQPLVEQMNRSPLADRFIRAGLPLAVSGEITPGMVAPVIAFSKAKEKTVFPMRWGFPMKGIPGKSVPRDLINARSETASKLPTFMEEWKSHRCIIPASYYFEWEHYLNASGKKTTGQKYAIQPFGKTCTWLAGLYRMQENYPVFVVLTREPSKGIRFIHDRMPFILPDTLVDQWINPEMNPDQFLDNAVTDMFFEKAV